MDITDKTKLLRKSRVPQPIVASKHAAVAPQSLNTQVIQRALQGDTSLMPAEMLALQRTVGNQAMLDLLGRASTNNADANGERSSGDSSVRVQAKLTVGSSSDLYEQEADAIADQVMRQANVAAPELQRSDSPQPQSLSESAGPAGGEVDSSLARRIQRAQNGGESLPSSVRQSLEPKLGANLGGVKVHKGEDAVHLTRELGAKAFTHKQHIFYGAGQSPSDLRLTAHEAVHTVQQGAVKSGNGAVQRAPSGGMANIQRKDEDDKKLEKLNKKIGGAKAKKGLAKFGQHALTALDWLTTLPVRVIDHMSVLDLHLKDFGNYVKTGQTRDERAGSDIALGGFKEGSKKRKMGRTGLRGLLSGVNIHATGLNAKLPWYGMLNPFLAMGKGQLATQGVAKNQKKELGKMRTQKQNLRNKMAQKNQNAPMDEESAHKVVATIIEEEHDVN